jgi:hypothetical protein
LEAIVTVTVSLTFKAALSKELSEAKAALANAKNNAGPKVSGAMFTQLERRVTGADKAAEAARDKNKALLEAMDEQIALLQQLRMHKEEDFIAAQ